MAAQVYCLLTAVLLCLSGYLSTTDATPSQKVSSYCPDKLTFQLSHLQGCLSDGDCSGGDKCCQFDRGPVCLPPVSTKPGECPPETLVGGSCAKSCTDDSNCPNNKKCCSNGCGRRCMAPCTVKPGWCPKPKEFPAYAKRCSCDGQCPATQKCCPTTSGHACSDVYRKGPQNH